MRIVLQRVSEASVSIKGKLISKINHGMLVLLGIEKGDTEEQADWMAKKCCELRIFEDNEGKMNLDIDEAEGEILVVSQFTLCAEIKKGRRPSWSKAEEPERGEQLVDYFIDKLKNSNKKVKTGVFGAYMNVHLVNDGPVTIILDKKPDIKE
ncbi:MAG: D-tyrosyl-tRNA(Tyr) deacylase [Candidatus Coatesbacteria bacterium]|nr:D-tyrosyl-tRNA(Tyr) deacylase [Candidatus Coatesbacteria bacterium]